MQFWFPALALLAVVMAILVFGSRALSRGANAADVGLVVFKQQLAELDTDVASGRIAGADVEGLRSELGRRILMAGRQSGGVQKPHVSQGHLRLAALVPLAAILIYVQVGSPDMPDVPRAERLANAATNGDIEGQVAQIEDHLVQKPGDVQGWRLLASIYIDMGRFADAASAQLQLMALTGETAELKAGVAEALTLRDRGLMPELAISAAMDAFRLDATNPKAQFYRALALSQQGDKTAALKAFNAMLAAASGNAPLRGAVEDQIKRLTAAGSAPQISGEQEANINAMQPADQQAMIRSMVDGLAAKLASNSEDLQGWLRLIRARTVLGEVDKAKLALDKARGVFAAKKDALVAINALAKELKLP
jgi:cytochrome c-type biogenesis protein CcmH